jgi:hypothetical protein
MAELNECWKKIVAERACDIIDTADLEPDSRDLMDSGMRPETFIEKLSAAGKWMDAVKVMAHALPRREAVWWASVCAEQMNGPGGDADEVAALKAAENWVYEPTDEYRKKAFQLAQNSRTNSLGTLTALAAACSGGNLPLDEDTEVELDAAVFPQIVGGIVIMAATDEIERADEQFKRFLASGQDIACGGSGKIEEDNG